MPTILFFHTVLMNVVVVHSLSVRLENRVSSRLCLHHVLAFSSWRSLLACPQLPAYLIFPQPFPALLHTLLMLLHTAIGSYCWSDFNANTDFLTTQRWQAFPVHCTYDHDACGLLKNSLLQNPFAGFTIVINRAHSTLPLLLRSGKSRIYPLLFSFLTLFLFCG